MDQRVEPNPTDNTLAFLTGGGELGRRIREIDWSRTPLGPIGDWPQSLRSALSICLDSNFPIAIYWGGDLVLLYNDSWSPIPGEKHPWALGRPAREAWSDIWEIIDPLFRQVMTTGEATRSRDQLLPMHRHGFTEECYFDYTFSPIRGEDGRVEGVFNAVLETTARVVGERRLRTLRELAAWRGGQALSAGDACRAAAQVLAEDPHDLPFALLYLLDEGGRGAKLAGVSGVDRGTPASPAAIDPEDPEAPWPFRRVAETGRSVEVLDLPRRFGPLPGGAWPESPQRAFVLPLAMPGHEQLSGFVVAGISPRLAFDDDYKGFMDLLAGHVAAAVANARAYQEERRRAEALAELDRAKTAFFSNVSHEFRTPLTLMLGPVEDILARPADEVRPENRALLEVVDRNGQRLLRLVNTLLDFSRIEAGRVQASYEPTDLAAYTADLASNFRSACERAGLRLEVDCPTLDEPVYVDRAMWEKVVLNLLSNAFKFTFEGEIAVTLRRLGREAVLRVRDSGTGIPAEEMPRLFERFHRVENARGRTHEGSGIGLALVQELVRLHGGTVTAESALARGTTFAVSVPLGSAHLPADRIRAGRALASTASGAGPYVGEALRWLPGPGHGEGDDPPEPAIEGERLPSSLGRSAGDGGEGLPRVLVADDNADMRQYVARLLAGQYRVTAVPDGEAALAAARRRPPDLILTDVMMPRLDGFGLLRALRADPRTRSTPIVMLSARAGEESRVEGMEAGADDYLVKPFGARELLARVSAQLQMARLRTQAGEALRRSEERLRNIFDHATAGIAQIDLTGRFVLANRQFRQITGYSDEELRERTCNGITHPDDRPRDRAAFERALSDHRPYAVEKRYVRKDGSHVWVRNSVTGVGGRDGSPEHMLAVSIDVTDRKRAEEERERFFAVGADLLAVVGFDGYFKEVSPACELTLGWTPGELTARPWADFLHPDDREPSLALDREVMGGREILAFENRYLHRDGSYRWLNWKARPYPGEGLIYAGATDITGRKRAEGLQAAQRGVLEMIARGAPLADVLAAVCRLIEGQEPGLLCSILMADDDGRHTGAGFGPSLPGEFVRSLRGIDFAPPHVGPCCVALDCGREVVVEDIENDGRWSPQWRALNLGHGLRACRSIPIRGSDGAVLASVAVFRRRPGDPGPADRGLLGIATYLAGVAIERRRAEDRERRLLEEAATANAKFRAFFDQGPLFAGIMALDGTLLEANRLSLEACGYAKEEVIGRKFWDCPWWSPSPELMRVIRGATDRATAGELFRAEMPYHLADGGQRMVDFILMPIKDEAGRVLVLAPTGTDVTDRKRAERQLAEANEFLHSALDALSSHIAVLDEGGTILAVNEAWRRFADENQFSGHAHGVGSNYLRACEPGPGDGAEPGMVQGLRDVLAGRRPYFESEYPCHPPADRRWFVMRATRFRSPGPVRVVVAHEDVTKRKRAEEALREADRRKDEFLATLAHELRNPLAPIRTALLLMREPASGGDGHESERAMAERQVVHLARLVDDLMDVARISRGKIELRKEVLDLATVVSQAVQTARPLIEERRHHLTVSLPGEPVRLEGDPTRVEQVLWNLLNNAAKYTLPGGRIALAAARTGAEVVIRVRDTGIGIEPAMLPRLFQMFVQVGEHREHAQGGLGIGLGLVKSLVEMHGGSIEARSEGPGAGSEFVVRLPALTTTPQPAVEPGPDEGRRPRASLPRRRILVVDDNADAANSLARVLTRLYGQDVRVAHDGPSALGAAGEFRPEVALLDIGMPGMDGYEVARRLRRMPELEGVTLVALTGWGQDSDRERSSQSGFDRHFVKPVDPAMLEKLLAGLQSGSDAARAQDAR